MEAQQHSAKKLDMKMTVPDGITGAQFFKKQVFTSIRTETDFKIKLPEDVEELMKICELCKLEELHFCCPEHCCDVSCFANF